MDRTVFKRLAVAAIGIGVVAALTPSVANAGPAPVSAEDRAAVAEVTAPDMLTAMQRDYGLSRDEALTRLAREQAAAHTEEQLRADLAGSFGGAWLDDQQRLVVAVTDASQAPQVRAAGAIARVVAHSEHQLEAYKSQLDRATAAPAEITSWYVDVTTNTVVVRTLPSGQAAATEFIEANGLDEAAVRIEVSSERPQPLYDIRGGDAYYMGGGRCSVGFSVTPRGFVTAGHCGRVGTTTRGYNQVSQGTFQRSNFPGADAAYVATNSNWTPRPWVNQYSGNFVVRGSQVAAIGAATCRSGSTTGWRCGTITHRNQTVNYPQGTVRGLTRTTACAEPGDSGGSFVAAGGQAQGVTSGGSGNCRSGGVTYFQPVNPILNSYGLRLVTG